MQLTVEEVFGTVVFDPAHAFFVTTTAYVVESLTGTLNGEPVSLLVVPGFPSWLDLVLEPSDIQFSAGDADYRIIADIPILLQGPDLQVPLIFHANIVSTPEPTSLVLLVVGLSGLAWRRFSIRPRRD
jgi:hypothetical protein